MTPLARSAELDGVDPLAPHRDLFVRAPGVVAYLDGNSLGRPLEASVHRVERFLGEEWGGRLIRGWDEGWLDLPLRVGDELARVALGAEPGQVAIGDSTTVLLYKLVHAAVEARPGRTELVVDRADFPTDRYVVEGVARDRGLSIRWIDTDAAAGVTPQLLADAVGPNTAAVVLSHVSYRSGYLADMPALTGIAREAGALVVWDLCHSVGVVPVRLDAWGVDLAVGCTYKYLGGGPGSPAFLYVRSGMQGELRQPVQGWLGSARPFEMAQGYEPAAGIRAFLSGTPPIVGMLAMRDMIALIGEVGIDAVRAKSVALTEFAIQLVDELLPQAALASPRDPAQRGSHITVDHADFESLMPGLWAAGVIPDFRRPRGIRLGLSPMSTSFSEVEVGVRAIAELL
ncbi:MAG: kynureninase [Rhodoglobus sp.]|nr:kynureninase [Rhodoglobus sp.]